MFASILVLIIILVVTIVITAYVISVYNKLVVLLNRAKNAFGQIDVQLKKRYDLIPNLVEVAKRYMAHEEQTLTKVIAARNNAKGALDSLNSRGLESGGIKDFNKAESGLLGALGGLNVAVEAYPDLKANKNMMQLSEELSSMENKIAFSRQAYNDSVMNFNITKQIFPANIVASLFSKFKNDLDILEFEESTEELNKAPKVQF